MVETAEARDLLLFALGPVQSFIATARRTQDLWLGSQLLSNLALVGVGKAEALRAGSPVFPTKVDGRWPRSIPNRFVVTAPAGQGKNWGVTIAKAVGQAWLGAAAAVRCFFSRLAPESGWESAWERQIGGWLELYWISWPWDGSEYGKAYQQAGLAMDARKQIRVVAPSEEPGEKCTLCGLRQALHGSSDTRRDVRAFWDTVRQNPDISQIELREGEQLCAVCAVKRFASKAGVQIGGHWLEPERFPSTSSVAAAVFKANLLDRWSDLLSGVVRQHLDALDDLRARGGAPYARAEESLFLEMRAKDKGLPANRLLYYDGDFFYAESLADDRLADVLGRQPTEQDRERAAEARRTLKELLRAAKQLDIPAPHPYLVVLTLDGDNMGRLLSSCQSTTEHRAISEALVTFSERQVPRLVEQDHAGRVVYAGGDDLLALVPVDHVLHLADALRREFASVMRGAGRNDCTASVGVAVIHHTHPLENGLLAARRAERTAKRAPQKNTLALEVMRRSGECVRMGAKWDYQDVENTIGVIDEIREHFARQKLSAKLSYDLRGEARALAGVPVALERELGRLIARHWQLKPVEDHKDTITSLAELMAQLGAETHIGIEPLAEWLLFARFLAQGGRE